MNIESPRNIKLLNADEIEYFLQKYKFVVTEKKEIKAEFNYIQSRTRYLKNDGKSSYLYFVDFPSKRKLFTITNDGKTLFIKKEGKWNLIFLQQMLFKLKIAKINYKKLTDEQLTKFYNDIEMEHFLLKGKKIN